MSETPERIWAFAPDIFDNLSVWQDAPSPAGDTIEYVRADRIEELEAKLAACEKYRDAYAECDRIATQAVRELEADLAYWQKDSADAWDKCEDNRVKLAKAVNLIELAIELGRWDLNPSFRDELITFTAEMTGGKDE